MLDALSYSHKAGIVHRDIKPANVMLTSTGQVKVMDFGIARAVADTSATMTQTAAVIGTAQYLSPEQARGETVDSRSDIYSAGCLLYELLVGRPPFQGDSPVSVAYQHVREAPVPPSQLDPEITAGDGRRSCSRRWRRTPPTATRRPRRCAPTSDGCWPAQEVTRRPRCPRRCRRVAEAPGVRGVPRRHGLMTTTATRRRRGPLEPGAEAPRWALRLPDRAGAGRRRVSGAVLPVQAHSAASKGRRASRGRASGRPMRRATLQDAEARSQVVPGKGANDDTVGRVTSRARWPPPVDRSARSPSRSTSGPTKADDPRRAGRSGLDEVQETLRRPGFTNVTAPEATNEPLTAKANEVTSASSRSRAPRLPSTPRSSVYYAIGRRSCRTCRHLRGGRGEAGAERAASRTSRVSTQVSTATAGTVDRPTPG